MAWLQASLEQAENTIKQHEAFMNTMDSNDEKINQAIQYADKLEEEEHYNAEKVLFLLSSRVGYLLCAR